MPLDAVPSSAARSRAALAAEIAARAPEERRSCAACRARRVWATRGLAALWTPFLLGALGVSGVGAALGVAWAAAERGPTPSAPFFAVEDFAERALDAFPDAVRGAVRVSYEMRSDGALAPVELRLFLPAERFAAEILPRHDRQGAPLVGALGAEDLQARLARLARAAVAGRPHGAGGIGPAVSDRGCPQHRVGPALDRARLGLDGEGAVRALRVAFGRPCR